MRGLLTHLLVCIVLCGPWADAMAQSTPDSGKITGPLLQQNPLIADVAHNDPDGLWSLVSRLEVLTTARQDSGSSRGDPSLTPSEAAQINANPAFRQAYAQDPGATVALLRASNDALRRAQLRDMHDPPRLALVIGSSGDRDWGRLPSAANDANLVAGALARRGFDLVGGHALIDPDRAQLLKAIRDLSRSVGPDTVALLYYAGHGVQLNGRNFLVPTGAPIPHNNADYDQSLVAVDDMVLRQMQRSSARMNIILFDACRDRQPVSQDAAHAPFGLAPIGASVRSNGTVIMYSTAANDVAHDAVGNASDSPFATAFVAAIAQPGVELRDVFDRVQQMVDQATDHRQQAWISYSAISKFYFRAMGEPDADTSSATINQQFHCPRAGSSLTLADASGVVTGAYQGADPDDPVACLISTSDGETKQLLYNFFETKYLLNQDTVRKAMGDLLSGRQKQVEFQVFIRSSGMSSPTTYLEDWKRLDEETLPLGKLSVATVKFQRTRGVPNFNLPREVWNLWYYPAGGVFVRSERVPTTKPGFSNGGLPGVFEATSFKPS